MKVGKVQLGYACICMELSESKPRITSNRGMIKRTFKAKGIEYASELSRLNTEDLIKIIQWNNQKGIKVFRMSSCLFPWMSEYSLKDLPDYQEIADNLGRAGQIALENGQRLSFHPGPFNILSSPKQRVVESSFIDLTHHGEIMDLLGQPRDRRAKINIHVGASYGNRQSALERWCSNYEKLPESVKTRLTVENDDRANLYSTKDLYYGVYQKTGVPIVFDFHHHNFNTGDQTHEEALKLAASTWGDVKPTCHYSESKRDKEGAKVSPTAHSAYIYDRIEDYGVEFDCVIEAKAKEKALFKYVSDYQK